MLDANLFTNLRYSKQKMREKVNSNLNHAKQGQT